MESDSATLSLFVEDINNCLDLFYHLIGLSVGYDGRLIGDSELLSPAELKQLAEQQLELF
jgi:hypothetical protein